MLQNVKIEIIFVFRNQYPGRTDQMRVVGEDGIITLVQNNIKTDDRNNAAIANGEHSIQAFYRVSKLYQELTWTFLVTLKTSNSIAPGVDIPLSLRDLHKINYLIELHFIDGCFMFFTEKSETDSVLPTSVLLQRIKVTSARDNHDNHNDYNEINKVKRKRMVRRRRKKKNIVREDTNDDNIDDDELEEAAVVTDNVYFAPL